jgi:hypothetical protein
MSWVGSRGAWSRCSCVARFPEPNFAAATCELFLNLGFALGAGNVLNSTPRQWARICQSFFRIYWSSKGILRGFSATSQGPSSPCHIQRGALPPSKPTLHLGTWHHHQSTSGRSVTGNPLGGAGRRVSISAASRMLSPRYPTARNLRRA